MPWIKNGTKGPLGYSWYKYDTANEEVTCDFLLVTINNYMPICIILYRHSKYDIVNSKYVWPFNVTEGKS